MYRPRVIPCLLLKNSGLVKSIKFKDHRYIGDPINAVKIFNDLRADELVFLDIAVGLENRKPNFEIIQKIADESNMPFAYGGGITCINDIRLALKYGAEKVVINSAAIKNFSFVNEASQEFGSSTIVVSIDVKKNLFGKYIVKINSGTTSTEFDHATACLKAEDSGAGEIILTSIDCEGSMKGYDYFLYDSITGFP
ncbi:MAG: imidazole glycerol phosphate synthase subunit HisF, partial [Ignavibacteriaceae bacterium]|nr:imidazole glycerol phosphate synthase subunit HisF [Ignavibacteriaceae bacterium]